MLIIITSSPPIVRAIILLSSKMDAIIDFNEVADFLKNPPSLEPRPDFTKIRALRKHIVMALAQLQCPQEAIHGWSGLAVDPAAYQLLTGKVFIIPPDPGPTAVYPAWAAPNDAQTIDAKFLRAKNYYLSYQNIHRACFRMLDATVLAQFKVSNNPNLTGWNATMSVLDILDQLQNSYGKPDMMTIFNNETLYRSPMAPSDSPEVLFYRIEQCQEVQIIGKVPFTMEQIIANAVRILIGSNSFQTRSSTRGRLYPSRLGQPSRRFFRPLTIAASPLLLYEARRARMGMQIKTCTTSLMALMMTPTMIQSRQSHPSPSLQPLQRLLLAHQAWPNH